MTNGLCKGRNTLFINGYAVQWFSNILKETKIFIYISDCSHRYVCMTDITLDYIADAFTVEGVAREKIKEIESL